MLKYIKDSFNELHKVVFPTKSEMLSNFKMVVTFTIILTLFLGLVDFGINYILKMIFN